MALNSTHSDNEVVVQYEDIVRTISHTKTSYTVVMGDFNAKVGVQDYNK